MLSKDKNQPTSRAQTQVPCKAIHSDRAPQGGFTVKDSSVVTCGGGAADKGYSHGLSAGTPGLQEGHVNEWTTPDQIGTTHHTPGLQ